MAKIPNYTNEQVSILTEGYNPNASQDERDAQVMRLAKMLAKSPNQVRMKLTSMGIYIKRVYQKKGSGESKDEIVTQIEESFGVPANLLESLGKATKVALSRVRNEIRNMEEEIEELRDMVEERNAIIEAGANLEENE